MEPYWPWWAVLTFFGSGAFCAWLWTISRRPSRVDCPHCEDGSQVVVEARPGRLEVVPASPDSEVGD